MRLCLIREIVLRWLSTYSASDFSVPKGTFVALPGRDLALPQFYVVDSYPLLAHVQNVRCIYVYVQDMSREAMQEFFDYVKPDSFVLPEGTIEGIAKASTYRAMSSLTDFLLTSHRVPRSGPWRLCLRQRSLGKWGP